MIRQAILNIAACAGLLVLLGVAYLCFWPVPVEPVSWHASAPAGYTGPYAANTRLANINLIDIGDDYGPEHIAVGKDGRLYAAMTSGNILSMELDGSDRKVFANTGGRVLGFDFDADGRMIAADAMRGLLAIDAHGVVSLLTDSVSANDPIGYANAVVAGSDGTIYFTQSSMRFSPREWGGTLEASVLDIIEQSATGRVLAYDPATNTTRVVAKGLSFANGLALATDELSLFVNETGRYRIWRVDANAHDVDMKGNSAQVRILLDNLPGYPDNLVRGRDGRIWVGLFRPRNPAADSLANKTFLRRILLRLPRSWLPTGKPYGHVFAINEDGDVLDDLQDSAGLYPETTGATETTDRLYVHSLHAHAIGWVPY
ncbi:SMP-30/gluconolactonase/LRE family protein [Rhizobium halophytocola]|uniref:Sugar lactone lactonase YvrE n=1 Tax=Rhizobium halophytocola TaxID=735519 RepID=A0ABS4E4R8_9HYPH|nr:SMP-30/gluconolactonase/LRE family protein [Rhizobium halophytocola]MBP1852906.1 sugar lactone lactonase YvrE [Rhizobium halophytocola]